MDRIEIPTLVEFSSAGINEKHSRAFVFTGDWPAQPLTFGVEGRADLAQDDGPDYQCSAYLDVYYSDGSRLPARHLCFGPGLDAWQPQQAYLRPRLGIRRLVLNYLFEHKAGRVQFANATIKPCPRRREPDRRVVLVGDSNTITSYLPRSQAIDGLLEERLAKRYPHLRIEVENAGLGGETAKALLARKRYERDLLTLGRADVFVISYAGNDVRSYGPAEYEGYLRDMIARLRSDFPEARIVLQTAGYYDYPEHYAFDQNSRQAGHMEVVRKLAAAGPGGADALLDFYEITERLARGGDWDIRYRSHPQWKLVLDGRYDAELGGSAEYFSNPHYNRRGTGLIAEALDQLLAVEGWLDR